MKKFLLLKLMILLILVAFSAKIEAQQFTDVTSSYGLDSLKVKLGKGCYSWADYNNDGKLELIYAGDSLSVKIARIYALNKAGTQYRDTTGYAVPGGLVKVATPAIAWGDYNNDGYLDFAISGFTGTMGGASAAYSSTTLIYKNNGDGTFTQQNITLQGVDVGSLYWGDYNHDGKLDLLVMGRYGNAKASIPYAAQGGSLKITKLYLGTGTTFIDAGLAFTAGEGGIASLVDLDNDGWLDIYLTGYAITQSVYLNKKDGTFSTVSSRGLSGTSRGTVGAFGDYNYDGYTDYLTSYITSTATPPSAVASNFYLYKGGSTTFTQDATFVPGIGIAGFYNWNNGELAFADYDNDGYLDFFAGGYQTVGSTTSYFAKLYHNKGASNNYSFTDTTSQSGVFSSLPAGLFGGSAQWIDINNDNKLDLFFSGSLTTNYINRGRTYLFMNTGAKANTVPTAPTNLVATTNVSDVIFNWDPATDAETPQKGITYELRVGTTTGGVDIISPFCNPFTGYNRVSFPGKLTENDRTIGYLLKNLPAGTYYWSVHAIDGGLLGGSWSAEKTFTISSNQATNISASNVTATSMTLSWTNGGEANRSVFVKAGITYAPLLIDSAFTANTVFNTNTSRFRRTGWYCVYDGTGSTVDITGLTANTAYTVAVFEYAGSGATIKYNQCTGNGNPYTCSTYAVPTTQATAVTFTSITPSQFNVSWTNGNGTSRAVFVKATNSGSPSPVNFKTYTANTVFGSGSQIGTSGWYCIYNGTGSTVTVTGLSEKINYNVMVCEYNGIAGAEAYNTTTLSGNPAVVQTISSITTQAHDIQVIATSSKFDITWINGTGAKRAVFMTQGTSGTPNILDNQTYTDNTTFGQGTSDGNGWYCVYNGTGNSVSVTNLVVNTDYVVVIYEYNGVAGSEKYLTSAAPVGNPLTTKTDSRLPQQITFGVLTDKTFGDPSFYLSAKGGDSGNPIVFKSSDVNVVTIVDSTVTIVGAGNVNITATQDGNTNYADAAAQIRSLVVNKVTQLISFPALPVKIFGDASFDLTATGGQSGNPVTFVSDNASVATISGSTLTVVGVGTAKITASQAGNNNYFAAKDSALTFTVNKASQTISFADLPAKTYMDAPFTISVTSSSGLPVTIVSANSDIARLSNDTVTVVAPGTVNITASQAGNSNYLAAASVTKPFTINKAAQTITFGPLPSSIKNTDTVALTATSSSGLRVTYKSSDLSIAQVSGDLTTDRLTFYGAGSAVITANQKGNDFYAAATPVSQTITVTSVTDVPMLTGKEVAVYPNPAKDKVTIALGSLANNVTIGIYSLTGQQVTLVKAVDNVTDISVNDLKAGIYLIKIITPDGVITKQMVKQ